MAEIRAHVEEKFVQPYFSNCWYLKLVVLLLIPDVDDESITTCLGSPGAVIFRKQKTGHFFELHGVVFFFELENHDVKVMAVYNCKNVAMFWSDVCKLKIVEEIIQSENISTI